jgi:acyl dehydratase
MDAQSIIARRAALELHSGNLVNLPGGKTIAQGLLSLSLAPMFIRSVMGLKGLRNTLNYGADRIRYLSPVPAGSRIRGRIGVTETEDVQPDGLRVNYHMVIEIEGGQRPACVAELIALPLPLRVPSSICRHVRG